MGGALDVGGEDKSALRTCKLVGSTEEMPNFFANNFLNFSLNPSNFSSLLESFDSMRRTLAIFSARVRPWALPALEERGFVTAPSVGPSLVSEQALAQEHGVLLQVQSTSLDDTLDSTFIGLAGLKKLPRNGLHLVEVRTDPTGKHRDNT